MKSLEELEQIAKTEAKELEEKAFELFIKDYIKQDLGQIEKAKNKLDKVTKNKEERTLDNYKEIFNGVSMDGRNSGFHTYKEEYLNKVSK